jgi:hypothetical protein
MWVSKRRRRPRRDTRDDWKALLAVCIITVAIVGGSVAAVAISTRPSFEDRIFPEDPKRNGTHTLDWPTLRTVLASRPFTRPPGVVRVIGYMVSSKAPDHQGNVTEFLLVPNPGNWLHPPHLHPEDVIDVHMHGTNTTKFLARRAVWVEGWLSPTTPGNDQSLAITASVVSPLEGNKTDRPGH